MIYCVEDDSSIRDLVLYTLKASGFEATGFENAAAFWKGMKNSRPELILMDIMLPDGDGLSILKKLRSNMATAGIPVIMATAKGTEYDKVIGLDQGADDYLAKPFGMMEMVSRIRAVLRRTKSSVDSECLQFEDLVLNKKSHLVTIEGKPVELTLKEYDLLCLFLTNPGKVFTREVLLASVWDSDYAVETRTVDVHIATLRTKLKEYGSYIKTVRGVGYRMEDVA